MTHQLHMEAELLELRTKHPFIIARGGQSDYRTVWVRLKRRGRQRGLGRGGADQVLRRDRRDGAGRARRCTAPHCPTTRSTSRRPSGAGRRCSTDNPAARAALSSALHDLVGKRLGVPLYRLWGLDPARRRGPPSPSGSTRRSKMRAKVRRGRAVPDPQDQAGHRPGRRDPPDHPRRHRPGDPGRRQLRLDREAGDRACFRCSRSSA